MLYFVLIFGHARTGRHSRPIPCGRHSHAMLAKDESHALGQVGRKQGIYVVIQRRVGYACPYPTQLVHIIYVVIQRRVGYGQAVFWESPHRPEIREWGGFSYVFEAWSCRRCAAI